VGNNAAVRMTKLPQAETNGMRAGDQWIPDGKSWKGGGSFTAIAGRGDQCTEEHRKGKKKLLMVPVRFWASGDQRRKHVRKGGPIGRS